MLCFSCLSVHRTDKVGNGPEVWGSVRCEWHRRPPKHHVGPYSLNFDGYGFGGAGGWALQRAVTRLKVHWSTPSPPVNANIAHAAPAVDGRPALCHGPRGRGQAEASQDSSAECSNSESVSVAG